MKTIITTLALVVILAACSKSPSHDSRPIMVSSSNYEGVVLGEYPSDWENTLRVVDPAIIKEIGSRVRNLSECKRQYWFHGDNTLTIILIPHVSEPDWKESPIMADGGSIIYIDYDISKKTIVDVHENAPL